MTLGSFQNMDLVAREKISLQRKGAILSWLPHSNYYYLMEELDVTQLMQKRSELKDEHSKSGSFQAMFIRLLAKAASKHDFFYNVIMGSAVYKRKNLVFSTLVSFDQEIAGSVRIENPQQKNLGDLQAEIGAGRAKLRETSNVPAWVGILPMFMLDWMMRITVCLMYRFNFWSSCLPLERDVFGSVVVSNVGSSGSASWIVPQQNKYYAPPCSVVFGKAENNKIKVSFGFDHRLADGRHSMAFIKDFKALLEG
jgi:pyruvate/2-oxoglutarate dehydrogenase complex dihydrolipoamide acyltransferase (E2) component